MCVALSSFSSVKVHYRRFRDLTELRSIFPAALPNIPTLPSPTLNAQSAATLVTVKQEENARKRKAKAQVVVAAAAKGRSKDVFECTSNITRRSRAFAQ